MARDDSHTNRPPLHAPRTPEQQAQIAAQEKTGSAPQPESNDQASGDRLDQIMALMTSLDSRLDAIERAVGSGDPAVSDTGGETPQPGGKPANDPTTPHESGELVDPGQDAAESNAPYRHRAQPVDTANQADTTTDEVMEPQQHDGQSAHPPVVDAEDVQPDPASLGESLTPLESGGSIAPGQTTADSSQQYRTQARAIDMANQDDDPSFDEAIGRLGRAAQEGDEEPDDDEVDDPFMEIRQQLEQVGESMMEMASAIDGNRKLIRKLIQIQPNDQKDWNSVFS